MATDNQAIVMPAFSLNEMLRANVPSVSNRVYPPGTRMDAQMPRIEITSMTPMEQRVGLGEGFGPAANKALFYLYPFRVDVWDRDAKKVEAVSNEVLYAVWKNRNYTPNSPNDTYGQFINLEIRGGSPTQLNAGKQLFQRTLNVYGVWLSKASETWA